MTPTPTPVLPPSTLTRSQKLMHRPVSSPVLIDTYGPGAQLTVHIRHDDECGNGHNTFSITGTVVTDRSRRFRDIVAGGRLDDDIAREFPDLAPYLKWNGCSTDGPLHYVPNTLYWLGYSGWCDGEFNSPPNLTYARSTAIWPDLPEQFLADHTRPDTLMDQGADVKIALTARLPALMQEFQSAVESLGLKY